MTPAADDDKTTLDPRDGARPGSGYEPTNFAPTAPVERTEFVVPPTASARKVDIGNVLPVGTRLREFEITGLLGEGGFGIVYLAYDTGTHRRVALKEYMPTSLAARTESGVQVKGERYRETFDAGMKSFVNEARLLAQFDHPSLVRVYQFWEGNGTAYMVMPFYEGKNLRDTLRENLSSTGTPPDEGWLRTLLVPLTEALRVIHAENCYHRDIAPDNVMMLAGSQRPLLLDFGAARRVIGDMTQALTVILKPGYAPIEQYAEIPGMRQGPWTDVYALAAVVYFAITGKTPPVSVGRMLNDSYQPLAQVAAGRYSPQFLEAVDRALVVRPEHRTQSIEAFRDDLGLLAPGAGLGGTAATILRPPPDDVTRIAPGTVARGGGAPTQMRPPQPQPQTLMPGGAPTQMRPATQMPPAAGPTLMQPPAAPPTAFPPADEPTRMAPRPAPEQRTAAAPRPARPAAAPVQQDEGAGGRRGLVMGLAGVAVLAIAGGGAYVALKSPKPGPVPSPPEPAPGPGVVTNAPPPPVATVTPVPPPPPPPPQPFNAVREFEKAVQAQSTGFGVRATAPKTALRLGERLRFDVQSDRAGHLYVMAVGPDGVLAQIVPNRKSGSVQLRAGQTWQFPAKGGIEMDASEPLGPNHFFVMVSSEQRNFDALKSQVEGEIRVFAGGDVATAAVVAHGPVGSVLAGRPVCANAAACDASYGATILKLDVVR